MAVNVNAFKSVNANVTKPVVKDLLTTTIGVGALNGSISSTCSLVEEGDNVIHKTTFTCTAVPIAFADAIGNGQYGGVKLYDFPLGLICFLGATIKGALTLTEAAWIDTFDGDVGLGTAVHGDAGGLDGTSQDILQATATTQAVGQVATTNAITIATALTESGARWHDGRSTSKDLYLNYEIDDDVAHAAGNGTFTGTIVVMWVNLGGA